MGTELVPVDPMRKVTANEDGGDGCCCGSVCFIHALCVNYITNLVFSVTMVCFSRESCAAATSSPFSSSSGESP